MTTRKHKKVTITADNLYHEIRRNYCFRHYEVVDYLIQLVEQQNMDVNIEQAKRDGQEMREHLERMN